MLLFKSSYKRKIYIAFQAKKIMQKAKKIGEIPGFGEVYESVALLDEQVLASSDANINASIPTTPEEIAHIRMSRISYKGARTNILPLAMKGGEIILYKPSQCMSQSMAFNAKLAHQKREYPTMNKEVYEFAQSIAKSQTGINPEDRTAISIPEGNLELKAEMDVTRFLLGKQNKKYFDRFSQGTLMFYSLPGEFKDRTTYNYLWFDGDEENSDFVCNYWGLNAEDVAFGIKKFTPSNPIQSKDSFNFTVNKLEAALFP